MRRTSRSAAAGWIAAAALALAACAEPEPLSSAAGSAGSGGAGAPSCTQAPDCGGCNTCVDVCSCWGTAPAQCHAQCGAAGSAGTAGTGGSGATGGSAGSGGGSGFGGSGGAGAGGGSGFGGSGGSAGGAGGAGSCCTPSLSPGCSNSTIASCVCAQDSYCCSYEWDDLCVSEVSQLGCGSCGGSGGAGGGGGTCSYQLQDPVCSACMQSYCCTQAETCFNSTGCAALTDCITQSCPTAATIQDIGTCIDTTCTQYGAYESQLMGYLSCLSTQCSAECGI